MTKDKLTYQIELALNERDAVVDALLDRIAVLRRDAGQGTQARLARRKMDLLWSVVDQIRLAQPTTQRSETIHSEPTQPTP